MITDRSRSVKTVLSSLIRHDWVLEVFWRICVLLFVPSLRGSSESCPNLTHVFMLFSDRRQLTLSSLLHLVFNCSITTAATASHTTDFLRTQSHYFGWQCTTCPTSPIELSLPSSCTMANGHVSTCTSFHDCRNATTWVIRSAWDIKRIRILFNLGRIWT